MIEQNIKEIAKFLKDSVKWLQEHDCGCCYKQYQNVYIVAGWSSGFDKDDPGIIHSKDDPDYSIVFSVRAEPGYMQTDLDLDFPYLYNAKTGDCWDVDICPKEGYTDEMYESDAKWLLDQADKMSKYAYESDGKIIGTRKFFELSTAIDDCYYEHEYQKLKKEIETADLEEDEREKLLAGWQYAKGAYCESDER